MYVPVPCLASLLKRFRQRLSQRGTVGLDLSSIGVRHHVESRGVACVDKKRKARLVLHITYLRYKKKTFAASNRRVICKHTVALLFTIFPGEADAFMREEEESEQEEKRWREEHYREMERRVKSLRKEELQRELLAPSSNWKKGSADLVGCEVTSLHEQTHTVANEGDHATRPKRTCRKPHVGAALPHLMAGV